MATPTGITPTAETNKTPPTDTSTCSVSTPEEVELEPTAGLSSAASCINISLPGYRPFRPVYTHQCFEGEYIAGFSPTDEAQDQARSTADRIRREANLERHDAMLPHSSYRHHKESDPRLEITLSLSPDCSRCSVTCKESAVPPTMAPNEIKKRPIVDTTNSAEEDKGSQGATKRQKPSVTFADDQQNGSRTNVAEEAMAATTSTAAAPSASLAEKMEIKDILCNLRRALPNIMYETEADDGIAIKDGYLQQPHGTILTEYKRKIRVGEGNKEAEEEGDFVITLANGSDKDVTEYHNKVQGLAMFFIETADNVDLSSDEGGGFWKVMQLYRRHENKYSLVGYTTLFHFNSPFKKPKPGIVMRVCQALILPPYQRGGHGSMMLHQVYNIADGYYDTKLKMKQECTGNMREIVEVNVEDPAPGFVALRNKVDFQRFKDSVTSSNDVIDSKYLGGSVGAPGPDIDNETFWLPLPESEAIVGAAKLRITPQQIMITHEIFKLYALEAHIARLSGSVESIEGLEKKYRLMVKKRLLKLHREELGACGGKEEQKAKLGLIFHETLRHYRSLLKTI